MSINRGIYKFTLKDEIVFQDLGNTFNNTGGLAYSMAMGLDRNIYFGSSSNSDGWCHVSEYDPYKNIVTQYGAIDTTENYTLYVSGDAEFVYAVTGQHTFNIVALNKKTGVKKVIANSAKRIFIITAKDGIIAQINNGSSYQNYFIRNGNLGEVVVGRHLPNNYQEANVPGAPKVSVEFSASASAVMASVNDGPYTSTPISSARMRTNIRSVFSVGKDLFFVGDYYGYYYHYDAKTDSSYLVGNNAMNIYSTLADTDSTEYIAGYPSGQLLFFNKKKPWNVSAFQTAVTVTAAGNTNPKMIGYWRSTPAQFHHVSLLVKDNNGNVVGAGDVIRTQYNCSIGSYNPHINALTGYDCNKIPQLGASGLAVWNKYCIFSTSNAYRGIPKLYFYNSVTNMMDDSLSFKNLPDYGQIYVKGDELTGIAGKTLYKVNLKTKAVVQFYTLDKTVKASYMLHNGNIIINTEANLPTGFAKFLKVPYAFQYNESNGDLYFVNGMYVEVIRNIERY